ncbi:MAG TPA: MOSC domain-containing protein [Caldilineaceae bacterium]|nr:MOSC domain-containing protein [Caldilineaceae bacterium]
MAYRYPVDIKHIFISAGHNYFGKPKDGPGAHPTLDVAEVEARAGRGLVGDRYYGAPAHYEAQVTFFAWEVFAALQAEFNRPDLSPILTRRNIVLAGANLNQLIDQEFTLDFGEHGVRLVGVHPCSPCAWMDAMLGEGAHTFLRGRGGLRARVLSSGVIRRGPATLVTARALDLSAAAAPLARPRLP